MVAINAKNRNLRNSDTTELSGQQVLLNEGSGQGKALMRKTRSSQRPWGSQSRCETWRCSWRHLHEDLVALDFQTAVHFYIINPFQVEFQPKAMHEMTWSYRKKRSIPSEQETNSGITNLVSAATGQGEALKREKRSAQFALFALSSLEDLVKPVEETVERRDPPHPCHDTWGNLASYGRRKRSLSSEQEASSEITNPVSAEPAQEVPGVREKKSPQQQEPWRVRGANLLSSLVDFLKIATATSAPECAVVLCGRKKRSLPSELESNSRTTWPLLNSNSYNNPTNLLISSSNQNLGTSSINSFATSQNLSLLHCIANATDTSSSRAYQILRSQGVNFVPSTNEAVNYGMRKFDLFVNEQIKTLSSKEEQNRIRLELKATRPDIRMSLARGVEFSGNKGLDDVLAKSKDCFVSTYMSGINVSALNREVVRN